jgi:hypothetical protein
MRGLLVILLGWWSLAGAGEVGLISLGQSITNSTRLAPPPVPFSFAPDTASLSWYDKNSGGFGLYGNLAYFRANADVPTVSGLFWRPVDSVIGLGTFPSLNRVSISSDSISPLASLDISGNPLITSLTVIDCSLPVAVVNSLLVSLDGFGLSGGHITLSGQTPAAPPSGAGLTAVTNLLGKGWTVTTD